MYRAAKTVPPLQAHLGSKETYLPMQQLFKIALVQPSNLFTTSLLKRLLADKGKHF